MAQVFGGALKAGSRQAGPAAPGEIRVRLLGPVDVAVGEEVVSVPGRLARTMLATLAVRAGQVVPSDVLIEAMWGDVPPRTAAHALQVHASTLRRILPAGLAIAGRRGGYALQLGEAQLDTDEFEALAGRGRVELGSGGVDAARELLRAALARWRGPVLADVPWERFADGDAQRWEELRDTAWEDLVDAELAAGRHHEMVAELETLVDEQPYRERRWGQLMIALYRSGRQADALQRYREVRTVLAEALGVDPSPPLRRLERQILAQDGELSAPDFDDLPVTRFARGPAGRLAYQVLGSAPVNLVFVPGFGGNVEIRWEQPNLARLYRRLARSTRLVLLDKRGTGLSDRDSGIPAVEDQIGDLLAVMDAAGMERAALFGVMDGGTLALLAASAHPERVEAVITYACFSAYAHLGDHASTLFAALRAAAETGLRFDDVMATLAPSRSGDSSFAAWMGRYMRMSAGPGGAVALLDRFEQIDIRAVLPTIAAPVLALHREGDRMIPPSNAEYIAGNVQDGRGVTLPGSDSVIWAGDVDAIAAEIEAFLG